MIHWQNTYADITSNVLSGWYGRKFLPGTRFYKIGKDGRAYWYADEGGKRRYIGKDSPELAVAMAQENMTSELDKATKKMIRSLVLAGMPVPGREIGDTLHDLAWNGFFRLRGVLVGTVAFQTYFPMFGETPLDFFKKALRNCDFHGSLLAVSRTADIDIARFHSISVAIDDSMDVSLPNALGPEFSQIPSIIPGHNLPKWRNGRTGLMVDLLAPLRAPVSKDTTFLPGVGAIAAKLKFLDFLIYDEIPTVVLHGNGIPVNVPRPERYAVHKLIVTQERRNPVKADKDLVQGIALCSFLLQNHTATIRNAFSEAAERGPGWRRRLSATVKNGVFPEKLRNEFLPLLGKKEENCKNTQEKDYGFQKDDCGFQHGPR